MTRAGLRRALGAALAVMAIASPLAAHATTGTKTDKKETVTIAAKGATWVPSVRTRKISTGVTFRMHIVNKSSARHWFQIGKRKTKVIAPGKSTTFFYAFTKPGSVLWHVGLGQVSGAAFHGTIKVVFPPHFN
jgi:hypothetical protein